MQKNKIILVGLSKEAFIKKIKDISFSRPKNPLYLAGSRLILQVNCEEEEIKIYCTNNHVFALPLPPILGLTIKCSDSNDLMVEKRWIIPTSSLVISAVILLIVAAIIVFIMDGKKEFWLFWPAFFCFLIGNHLIDFIKSRRLIRQKLASIDIDIK